MWKIDILEMYCNSSNYPVINNRNGNKNGKESQKQNGKIPLLGNNSPFNGISLTGDIL